MDQDFKAAAAAAAAISSSMGDDCSSQSSGNELEDTMSDDLRRGPWTLEEDFTLMNYISIHGEGRWNSLAKSAGLKRTGKSCRLRWLNYLRPDVRRGNISLEEQLLILELHSQWGNRWSKIAQYLPGRTDNEIKNYWRTRVQKQAKQLRCDVNSKQFKDTMRYLWMPRLVEKIQATATPTSGTAATTMPTSVSINYVDTDVVNQLARNMQVNQASFTPENSSTTAGSTDSLCGTHVVSPLSDCYSYPAIDHSNTSQDYYQTNQFSGYDDSLTSPAGYFNQGLDSQAMNQNNEWMGAGNISDSLWDIGDSWFLQQQPNSN